MIDLPKNKLISPAMSKFAKTLEVDSHQILCQSFAAVDHFCKRYGVKTFTSLIVYVNRLRQARERNYEKLKHEASKRKNMSILCSFKV